MAAGGIIADAAFVLNDGRWLHVRVSGDVVDIWREETLVAEAVDRKLFDPQVVVALPDGRGTVAVSIDYVDGLQGSGFKIENPAATGTCGCGHSFSM